jgi:hypothetical protein
MSEVNEVPVLELAHLATMTLTLRAPLVIEGGPTGTRWIVEAEAGRLEGRLNATIEESSSADWLTVSGDGTGTVDARLTVRTDDGALVLLQYHGRSDLSAGTGPLYIAPRFDSPSPAYSWLNRMQAVGKGLVNGRTLRYELYEVR